MALRVHLFEALYEDIKANEPLAKGDPHQEFTVNLGDEMTIEGPPLNRQDWRSYLTSFRQFWLQREATSVAYLLRHLPRHVDDEELRARLWRARRAWIVANRNGWLPEMKVNGIPITGHMVADLYLGAMFHSDPQKALFWRSLPVGFQQLIEMRFRLFESEARDVYIELRKVIKEAREAGVLRDEPSVSERAGERAPRSSPRRAGT